MIYLQSGKYFYKKTNNGKMSRISKKVYMENIDKIKESSGGGGKRKRENLASRVTHPVRSRVRPDTPLEEGMFSTLIRVKDQKFIDSTNYRIFNKDFKKCNINDFKESNINNLKNEKYFYNLSKSSEFKEDEDDVIKLFKSTSEEHVDPMLSRELNNSIILECMQNDKSRFTPKLKGYIKNLNRINNFRFTRSNRINNFPFTRSKINYGIVYEDGGINLDMLKNELINNKNVDVDINFKDFVNILIGLMNIHENELLHMDIKSLNILYNKEKRKFYLIDFGTLYNYSPEKQKLISDIKEGLNEGLFEEEQFWQLIEEELIIQYQHKETIKQMIESNNKFENMKKLDIITLADAMVGLIKKLPNEYNKKIKLLDFFKDMKKPEITEIDQNLIDKYNEIFDQNYGGKSKKNKSTKKVNNKSTKKYNNKSTKKVNNKSTKKVNNKSTKKVNNKSTKNI